MRLRNNPDANNILENHQEYVVFNGNDYKGRWRSLFNNDYPLYIEIGMGKGDFIIENAVRYPDINFIGIEKYPTVLTASLKKLDEMEHLDNLKLLKEDASFLEDLFDQDEVNRIYLNFSDPWPKNRHAKRRLTYPTFIASYDKILDKKGSIIFKTDNRGLFEYSLMSFNEYGCVFKDVCLDLHHSDGYEDNIETEYEKKFSPHGPIYRLEIVFKGV